MRIGIDISQIVYEGTGVGRYVREMVSHMLLHGGNHEFVLFGSSLRKQRVLREFYDSLGDVSRVTLRVFPIPPTLLDIVWNVLHIVPIEWFIGRIDVFWSSDWAQPPLASARGVTTVHDLIALKFPEETHNSTEFHLEDARIVSNISAVHARRMQRVKQECDMIFCDSYATKKDCMDILKFPESMLTVVYPGFGI
jgi:glycosyltransferase involved in cell wall biosynthesis